jgi:hypothetical protein
VGLVRWLPIALTALVACAHKDAQSVTKAQTDSMTNALAKLGDTTKVHGGPAGHDYGPPTGKIRVANLLEMNGQASGPVDLYEMRNPDSATAPLIKNLSFGQVSDYVSPRAADNYTRSPSNLYIFPAGAKHASSPYGSNIDNSGFAATDQITVALGPTNFAGTPSIALPALDEAGHRLTSARDSARAVPPGRALLIVLQANVNADSLPQLSLMIDGACPLPAALPKNTILTAVGTDLTLAVAPGTHTLGIVSEPRGGGLRNCGQTSTVSVNAGQRYVVFVYGVPADGFKTLTAPIAAP